MQAVECLPNTESTQDGDELTGEQREHAPPLQGLTTAVALLIPVLGDVNRLEVLREVALRLVVRPERQSAPSSDASHRVACSPRTIAECNSARIGGMAKAR